VTRARIVCAGEGELRGDEAAAALSGDVLLMHSGSPPSEAVEAGLADAIGDVGGDWLGGRGVLAIDSRPGCCAIADGMRSSGPSSRGCSQPASRVAAGSVSRQTASGIRGLPGRALRLQLRFR